MTLAEWCRHKERGAMTLWELCPDMDMLENVLALFKKKNYNLPDVSLKVLSKEQRQFEYEDILVTALSLQGKFGLKYFEPFEGNIGGLSAPRFLINNNKRSVQKIRG